jgi:hypothetical protein
MQCQGQRLNLYLKCKITHTHTHIHTHTYTYTYTHSQVAILVAEEMSFGIPAVGPRRGVDFVQMASGDFLKIMLDRVRTARNFP